MAEYRKVAPLARDAMAYVLAGGRGSRLMERTARRLVLRPLCRSGGFRADQLDPTGRVPEASSLRARLILPTVQPRATK